FSSADAAIPQSYLHQMFIVSRYLRLHISYHSQSERSSIICHFPALCLPPIILQKITAAPVLTAVARIPAPTTAAGFTLPYWLRYAITLTGISCREEILMIRKSHISLLATAFFLAGPEIFPILLSSSSFPSSSIAFSPAGVAAHPSPRKFAIKFVEICSFALCPSGISG